jgi:murein DD-endopeptidase MepM/ murein hydrolase activator NlpD
MSVTAFATGVNDKKQELNDVNKDIKDTKQDLNQVKDEKNQVRNQLTQIDQDLNAKLNELSAVENQLSKTQADLNHTKNELASTEENLGKTQADLEKLRADLEEAEQNAKKQESMNADRLRAMYMNSNASYLELLLESKSLNDLLNRADMITQMITYDRQVFDELVEYRDDVNKKKIACEEQEKQIQQYKADIENKKASLEQKEKEIQDEKAKIAQQHQEIQAAQNEKENLMSQLSKEESAIRKELDELERQSKELEKKIKQLTSQSSGTKYGGGIMTWPAPGYYTITSPFGWRIHPITHDKRYHTGIDISGAGINKTKAIAAADGTVIMAQRYGGYGNAVIIDHGGGITTLYGHGSSLKVSVGQKVKKGDTVLLIGSTGNSTGPHLHFEVRKNGTPVNPMSYLK